MKPNKFLWLSLVLVQILNGCSAIHQKKHAKINSPGAIYEKKAIDLERHGEYQQALFSWRVAAHLTDNDTDALKEIQRLEKIITKNAREHFLKGRGYYDSGNYAAAHTQFLLTLHNRPDHKQALYYLKKRLQNPDQAIYLVQPGDSFTRIASKIYNDPGKAYIIAYYNDKDPRKPLHIGTTLLLPSIHQAHLAPRSNIDTMFHNAQNAYKNKRYEQTLSIVRKIYKEAPKHPKARRLADAAYFDKGMVLFRKNEYLAALEQFKQVRSGYTGRNQAIAKARNQIKKLALDEKLNKAQIHLRNNAWKSVLNTTEEILDQDPNNEQAKMLFSNASYNLGKLLLERGEVIKAAELLNRIDPSYEDTQRLLSLAHSRMKAQAENHYRDGVKHFINEDLEIAIKEWKQALKLNPNHPKARLDIENAKRLLDKLKTLENKTPKPSSNVR